MVIVNCQDISSSISLHPTVLSRYSNFVELGSADTADMAIENIIVIMEECIIIIMFAIETAIIIKIINIIVVAKELAKWLAAESTMQEQFHAMDSDNLLKMTVKQVIIITINFHLDNSKNILTAIMFKLLRSFKSIQFARIASASSKKYSLSTTGKSLKTDQLLIKCYLKGNYRTQQTVLLTTQNLVLSAI